MKISPIGIIKKLRVSNPWRYKAPFLISVPYFMILACDLPFQDALLGVFFSCMTILGIAGFGYLVNDYSDREEDQKAGKSNVILEIPKGTFILLLGILLSMAVLPWVFYFPMDTYSYFLLGVEFLLFILYSLSPFRLKERGFAGVLCDALYAHAVPAVLAAYTFWLLGKKSYEEAIIFILILGTWQSFLGLRNILLHQIGDHDKDKKAGIRTFVVDTGKEKAWKMTKYFFFPGECIAFLGYWIFVGLEFWYFFLLYPVFALLVFFRRGFISNQSIPKDLKNVLYVFFDDFYVLWIALFFLVLCSVNRPEFLALIGIHILVFRNAVTTILGEISSKLGIKLGDT